MLLDTQGLGKEFGGLKAVDDVDFTVDEGTVTAIIGSNGAGKSTFFNLISGFYRPTSGKVSLGLAPLVTQQMLDAVVEINYGGITVLLAEQNAQAALGIAHKSYVIENGLVTLEGTKDELMGNSEVRRVCMGA